MARPRLVVHIGLHKTGTTSVQQYLNDHPYGLDRGGIMYPSTGRHPLATTQHALLAKAFDTAHPFMGAFALKVPVDGPLIARAFLHEVELAGKDTVIVSSEEMSRFDARAIAAFSETFDSFDICPVVFLRNYPDLFNAYYSTAVIYRAVTVEDPALGLTETDLLDRLKAWASIAGDGVIRVVDFDASPTGNSISDFMLACDIDARGLPDADRVQRLNRSVPAAVIRIVRELRRSGIAEDHIQGLVSQLASVDFREQQTSIPTPLYDELERRYAALFGALRFASFVRWSGTSAQPATRNPRPIYIADLAASVFALGRALGAR